MIKWIKFLWEVLKAWLNLKEAERQEDLEVQQAAVQHQQEIVQEAQEAINEVPDKTDDELADTAVDLGLVRRDSGGEDPGGQTLG
jgi:hypothetical protein